MLCPLLFTSSYFNYQITLCSDRFGWYAFKYLLIKTECQIATEVQNVHNNDYQISIFSVYIFGFFKVVLGLTLGHREYSFFVAC